MQGGYTELMLEQIRNSQEDDQTDMNRQVKIILQVYRNYSAHMCKLHRYMRCKFSIIGV